MVVAQIGVLVVGGVEVEEVGPQVGGNLQGVGLHGPSLTGEQRGVFQSQLAIGARGPAFEVGHLDAGGGVYFVGGNHQAIKQDGPQNLISGGLEFNPGSDGFNFGSVVGLDEARLLGVGAGKPAGFAFKSVQPPQDGLDAFGGVLGSVGLYQRLRQHQRVGVDVVGGDKEPHIFEGMANPGTA